MKTKLWIIVAVLVGLLVQACARPPEPQESCNFVMNAESQRVSWGDNVPVIINIDKRFPKEFFPAIEGAISEWNNSRGREILRLGSVVEGGDVAQDGYNVLYWNDKWNGFKPGEQARTVVYWSGARIFEADIRVNSKDFKFSTVERPGHVDMQSLLVHEFGHVLGLDHRKDAPSVMLAGLATGTLRREPQKNDLESVRCEY